jgi:hypothetical protein
MMIPAPGAACFRRALEVVQLEYPDVYARVLYWHSTPWKHETHGDGWSVTGEDASGLLTVSAFATMHPGGPAWARLPADTAPPADAPRGRMLDAHLDVSRAACALVDGAHHVPALGWWVPEPEMARLVDARRALRTAGLVSLAEIAGPDRDPA